MDQVLTFKVDLAITFLNTILQVIMWYFMAMIIEPSSLGYENIGYLPFVLIGSLAMFFVDRVASSLSSSFSADKDRGILKLVYLSRMNVVEYFFINFFTGIVFDFFTIILPMTATYLVLINFIDTYTTIHFGYMNFLTLLISLGIFIIGSMGFTLLSMGSTLFFKKGDPVDFVVDQFNIFFSGQIFPLSILPKFLMFLPKILPSAYIILVWRDTLFLNKIFTDSGTYNLIIASIIVNLLIFSIGYTTFQMGIKRAKLEGRWF